MEQVLTAPHSPWQNPFVERMLGSIRCECLDLVIVLDEHYLSRILRKYVNYYHSCRTHLSLEKDAPSLAGYNTQRLLEPIGNVAPVEYEMNYS